MKKGLLSLAAISLISAGAVKAQTDSTKNKQEITIEKRLNDGKPDKTIIIIDGDKVTVNGAEVEGMKDLRGRLRGMSGHLNPDNLEALRPQMQEMFRNLGPQMNGAFRNFNWNTQSNRAMLGVNVEKNEKGAKIIEVVQGSAAEKAGLQKEDIITAINADKIEDGDALIKTIGKYKPEETVDITVLRSGKERKLKAILGENTAIGWNNSPMPPKGPMVPPQVFNFRDNNGWQGFAGMADRPKFGFGIKDNEGGDGAVVTNVKDETSASKAGLKENDVITEAAGETVKTTDDLKRLLANNRDKPDISIKVLRSGKTQSLTLKVPKKIKTAEL
jgi:serine protease Do